MVQRAQRTEAGRRLLDSAAHLFYHQGINAVGVAGIAEVAGVTKKTLYDCFGSKTELVVAYLEDRHSRWWDYLEQRLEGAAVPRALVLFDCYFDHPWLDVSRGCGFLNGAAELPADHPGLVVIRRHKAQVRARLGALVAADYPVLHNADSVAEHVFLLLEGAVAHQGIDSQAGHRQQARQMVHALLTSGHCGGEADAGSGEAWGESSA
ncbi:TetR/AcrR family transcriptional regulator [Lipingzhangella sp. LS1_29]|uniref:TetR/AcrR family transcriptional regulator n=1 Tax=Lipingzhangella rawalii TaxID=2055835 RepID=A0ABU2H192_9ACTN|nr:TetR/AcrR family transcriptional regulator [Lipingzhangella rawalii]MDS1269080.1 TetR/AcrR family transcriptional regulator [Lipingzhangella rawalii]